MQKLVAIDSCMREASRTREIYTAVMDVLSKKYDTSVIDVNALALPPLTPQTLERRNAGDIPAAAADASRRIAEADRIVIAAPFWDMGLPGALKAFLENVSLPGATFGDDGESSRGLCNCKKVMYITTRGMNIKTHSPQDQGSSYLQALAGLWGLGEVITVAAWGLDRVTEEEALRKVRETASLARALAQTF